MNDAYVTRNGVRIIPLPDGSVEVQTPMGTHSLGPNNLEALTEYALAREDERLGRWRWPADPEYVAYPSDQFKAGGESGWVIFLHEPSGLSSEASRHARGTLRVDMKFALAARAFFDAHPERKPWDDAEPGDVWMFGSGADDIVLGWRTVDRDWDVIGPARETAIRVADPIQWAAEELDGRWTVTTGRKVHSLPED